MMSDSKSNVPTILVKEGFTLNPKWKSIVKMVERNEGYCPCNRDNGKCPCNNYLDNDYCCCKLYLKN